VKQWLLRYLPGLAVLTLLLSALLLIGDVQQQADELQALNLWVLGLAVAALLGLLIAIGARLLELLRELRRRAPGARLTRRLVLLFLGLTLPPVLIVYFFSLEFITETIDGWFEVGQEQALQDSLELGQLFLDLRARRAQREIRDFAEEIGERPSAELFPQLVRRVGGGGPTELMVLSEGGEVLARANIRSGDIAPDRPGDFALLQINRSGQYAAAEPGADGGLKIRAAVTLPGSDTAGRQRILQGIYWLPESFTALAGNIEKTYHRYQNAAYLRDALQSSFVLILSVVLALTVLLAIFTAFNAAQRVVRPIGELARATGEVASGQFDRQLVSGSHDELGFLVHSFNRMTEQLAESRQALEEQRSYLETVLGRLSAGVLSMDREDRLITSNDSASGILGLDLERWRGRPLAELAREQPWLQPLVEVLSQRHRQHGDWRAEVKLDRTGQPLVLVCRGSQLPASGQSGHVVVFDDVTVLTEAQREAAWAEVARRLAHEVKNPLTPIRLAAERLQMKVRGKLDEPERALLEKSTQTIISQVDALRGIVNDFGDYAREPQLKRESVDLHRLIGNVAGLYETPDTIVLRTHLQAGAAVLRGDPGRLRQLLQNLVRNAMEARGEGLVVDIHTRREHSSHGEDLVMVVEDNGPGIPAALFERLFEPYVTSKADGSGLGLAIVKRIVDEHGGTIAAENRAGGGARITVRLPATAGAQGSTGTG